MRHQKKNNQKKIILFLLIFWVIGTCSLLLLKYFQMNPPTVILRLVEESRSFAPLRITPTSYPELKQLKDNTYTYSQLKTYFTKLAQKKGGVYAYEILKKADTPANTDLHLLGHAIGEQLYKQQGIQGMEYCTQDFRNACSHSIVVGALLEYGPTKDIFKKIEEACQKAPGGYGAYNLCYHGLGHGILAYENFDFTKGVSLCKKVKKYAMRTAYSECIGGATMEIIGGGDHDKQTWEKQSKKYLSSINPLELCQNKAVERKYFCYMYITPHLFTLAGFNPQNTHDPITFKKAFTYCDAIPKTEKYSREACFGGFGKEFVVLAKERDIRNIAEMSDQQVKTVYQWCSLAPHEEGRRACISIALNSFLWGGENEPTAAVKFCSLVIKQKEKDMCFSHLFSVVHNFIKNPFYQDQVCRLTPSEYKNICKKK